MQQPIPHGFLGTNRDSFVQMLNKDTVQPTAAAMFIFGESMGAKIDTVEVRPDAEENMYVPAGYTYFGQFIDHDLTNIGNFTFQPGTPAPQNRRTPLLDLDCVYGDGPGKSPELYDTDRTHLMLGDLIAATGRYDLLRKSGKAVIGDPRNDENSIVSQLQVAFISFHNAVVDRLKRQGIDGRALFDRARNEVQWTYQRIVVEDYLPRIIHKNVIVDFERARDPDSFGYSRNADAFKFFPDTNGARTKLPLEFAAAAYRFGHSMVRNGYLMRTGERPVRIFSTEDPRNLLGFQALLPEHVIDAWERFFPDSGIEGNIDGETFNPAPGTAAGYGGKNNALEDNGVNGPRLQFAYRIDTSVVEPLMNLPAPVADAGPNVLPITRLPTRNLLRGRQFELISGQGAAVAFGIAPLDPKYLVVRTQSDNPKEFFNVPITRLSWPLNNPVDLTKSTPLWFYILAEAAVPLVDRFGINQSFGEDRLLNESTGTGTQLGPVGGRILLETFHGILDSDPSSYRRHEGAKNWIPMVKKLRMHDLVTQQFR